ncbi:hypothetical protein GALMADRAFT_148885 [Galerina marginata CBS 339.88]|uniref:Uncharacterized protein n=1 Tax=Galerina marginata (strain CBS 339.88) TaxID=685588 RepID=A0A067S338_GALM3|nr:hypothetical protein GALMADRAFT_148885 [Galerina marginata CBS 339.88]
MLVIESQAEAHAEVGIGRPSHSHGSTASWQSLPSPEEGVQNQLPSLPPPPPVLEAGGWYEFQRARRQVLNVLRQHPSSSLFKPRIPNSTSSSWSETAGDGVALSCGCSVGWHWSLVVLKFFLSSYPVAPFSCPLPLLPLPFPPPLARTTPLIPRFFPLPSRTSSSPLPTFSSTSTFSNVPVTSGTGTASGTDCQLGISSSLIKLDFEHGDASPCLPVRAGNQEEEEEETLSQLKEEDPSSTNAVTSTLAPPVPSPPRPPHPHPHPPHLLVVLVLQSPSRAMPYPTSACDASVACAPAAAACAQLPRVRVRVRAGAEVGAAISSSPLHQSSSLPLRTPSFELMLVVILAFNS